MKTQQELEANYDRFIGIIKKYFTGERLEKLLHMYSEEELGSNLAVSPASSSKHYHNAHMQSYGDAAQEINKSGEWTDWYRNAVNEKGESIGSHEVKNLKLSVIDNTI